MDVNGRLNELIRTNESDNSNESQSSDGYRKSFVRHQS